MEQLVELFKQIQELAGVGIDALEQALKGGGGEGKPEGGPPSEGGPEGGPPPGEKEGGPPPEEEPPA